MKRLRDVATAARPVALTAAHSCTRTRLDPARWPFCSREPLGHSHPPKPGFGGRSAERALGHRTRPNPDSVVVLSAGPDGSLAIRTSVSSPCPGRGGARSLWIFGSRRLCLAGRQGPRPSLRDLERRARAVDRSHRGRSECGHGVIGRRGSPGPAVRRSRARGWSDRGPRRRPGRRAAATSQHARGPMRRLSRPGKLQVGDDDEIDRRIRWLIGQARRPLTVSTRSATPRCSASLRAFSSPACEKSTTDAPASPAGPARPRCGPPRRPSRWRFRVWHRPAAARRRGWGHIPEVVGLGVALVPARNRVIDRQVPSVLSSSGSRGRARTARGGASGRSSRVFLLHAGDGVARAPGPPPRSRAHSAGR